MRDVVWQTLGGRLYMGGRLWVVVDFTWLTLLGTRLYMDQLYHGLYDNHKTKLTTKRPGPSFFDP